MDATPHIAIRLFTTADRVRHGWRLDSRFIEEFWLPILGLRSGRRRGRRRPGMVVEPCRSEPLTGREQRCHRLACVSVVRAHGQGAGRSNARAW